MGEDIGEGVPKERCSILERPSRWGEDFIFNEGTGAPLALPIP